MEKIADRGRPNGKRLKTLIQSGPASFTEVGGGIESTEVPADDPSTLLRVNASASLSAGSSTLGKANAYVRVA
jgi:hypothetical protein